MRNFLLFVLSLIGACLLAYPFGLWTSKFLSGAVIDVVLPIELGNFIDGYPFAYLFLVPILFGIWGRGKKIPYVIIAAAPALLLAIYIRSYYFEFSIGFFALGVLIGYIADRTRNTFAHSG